MSPHLRFRSTALAAFSAVLLSASASLAATWMNNVSYGGSGPTMDLYVPDRVDASPGIVVALHYCSGTSGNTHSWFQSLSDQHGFLIISPDVGGPQNCWNATPARSGETAAIVAMVNFVATQRNADRTRVFAAGASSGACMTNALLAAYPDVFAGGSVLAGVPAGAWTGGNECSVCGQNPPNRTAQQWGDIVRNAFSFSGQRPRVQLFHGTSDTTLNYSNLAAEILQWTNVLGVSDANAMMMSNTPKSGWTRTSYRNASNVVVLESNVGQGVGHDLTGQAFFPDIVRFFGLDMDAPMGGAGGGGGVGGGGAAGSAGRANGGAGGVGNSGGGGFGGAGTSAGGATTGGATTGGATTGGAGAATTGGTTSTGGASGTTSTGGATTGGTTTGGATSTGGASAGAPPTSGVGGASTGPDGSSSTEGSPDDGGCGCRAAGGGDRSLAALAGVLAAFAAFLRRRR
jgi:poly(hydroxyalkanoate) depolymerase family esterase